VGIIKIEITAASAKLLPMTLLIVAVEVLLLVVGGLWSDLCVAAVHRGGRKH
jgi:hypothetical protein